MEQPNYSPNYQQEPQDYMGQPTYTPEMAISNIVGQIDPATIKSQQPYI